MNIEFTSEELKAISQLIAFYLELRTAPDGTVRSTYAQPSKEEGKSLKSAMDKIDKGIA